MAEEIVAALTLIAQELAAHEAATLPSQRRTSCKVAGLAVANAVSVLNHSLQGFTETNGRSCCTCQCFSCPPLHHVPKAVYLPCFSCDTTLTERPDKWSKNVL